MNRPPLIELRRISKRFGGVRALDDVSLVIAPGEIHCLAGENGSGKSTVIKIMAGVYTPDSGEMLIDGQPVGQLDPMASSHHGIQVIYQDFSLFGNLSVAENLAINTLLAEDRVRMPWARVHGLAQAALDRLGVSLDLDAEVDRLPTAGKQIVAIARALMARARLIIMDEPTTALTRHEVDALFAIVREIQAQGIAVLFVSHKMREMADISERLTVFRNGRKVAEGPMANFDEATITRAMTGQDIRAASYAGPAQRGATPALELAGLTVPGAVAEVSLALHAGDIVGISGLIGSGRTELALALFGMRPDFGGSIRIQGKPVRPDSVQAAIACGIAYVPEDRLSEGLFLSQSIERNLTVSAIDTLVRGGFIDRARSTATTREMCAAMQIVAPGPDTPLNHLSGGNAQRVVLARWLLTGARVLILNGPTVGVDVGSKAQIHALIRARAENDGLAVLMISDDVPELTQHCNRVLVMHRGHLVDEFAGAALSEEAVTERLKTLN